MYDYIVIGAGINGSWSALHLVKRGHKVLLLEQVKFLVSSINLSRNFLLFTFFISFHYPIQEEAPMDKGLLYIFFSQFLL